MQPLRLLLLLSSLAVSSLAQAPPVVAHWRLDESAGATANDSGPGNHHGTLVNFTGNAWVAGRVGNALSFDGVDDHVLIPAASGLPVYDGLGTPFSIAFWVKAPAQADRRVWSEQQGAPANAGPLFTLGSGSGSAALNERLRVFVRNDALNNVVNVTSQAVVFDDTWHHVVYADHAGRARLYIDGALDSVIDYSRWSYGPLSPLRSTFTLNSATIGAVVRNNAVATPLLGVVDDLRIYRSVLDDLDAQLLFLGVEPPTVVGSLAAFGLGCGRGPLDLVATGRAAFGDTIYAQLFRGEPGSYGLMAIGIGFLQPVDVGPFGFPGCTLYQSNVATSLLGLLGPAGSSMPFALVVPNRAIFAGTALSLQGAAFGSALELSPAAVAQVGR